MRLLLACCLLALPVPLLAGPAAADTGPAPAPKSRTVLNEVHTDTLDIQYRDGRLELQTRVGSDPHQFFSPQDVLFQLRDNDASRTVVPAVPEYAFLGAAGARVWIAPQVQDFSLLFAGWDTESLSPGVFAGDAVDIRLAGVDGPGAVEVFQTDSFGLPLRVFSSTDPAHQVLHQAVGSHVHANWGFTALGRYRLTFEVTATDTTGHLVRSGPVTYTWFVGGSQAGDVPAVPTATALAVSPVAAGPVTLTGTVTPAAAGAIEFADGDRVLGHAAVADGRASLVTALGAGAHSLTARFVPAYVTDFTGSTSAPATVVVSGDGQPTVTSASAPPTTSNSPAPPGTSSATSHTGTPAPSAPSSKTCVPAGPATATAGTVLADGHVDYAVRVLDGKLVSQVKDGTVAAVTTWRAPSSVVLHVVDKAATTVPAGDRFAFLGKPGDRIWQIPQTQQAGVLWLGWNTESVTAAQVRGDITWSLDTVDGPGSLAVFEFDPFGSPVILFDSGNGGPDTTPVRLGTHAHGNWTFTKPGIYHATFTHSATLTSGAKVSDKQVVTFAVGPVDPKQALPVTTSTPPPGTCASDVPANRANGGRGGSLASTGFSAAAPVTAGALAVLAGVLCLIVVRRRRSAVAGDR
ncbi:TIGR03773 family transporter-associated surface protein [Amycolatopsis sp. lyj-346]|uniref:TIGR03773 family transporter-associated surface protein n=1 Tax=Amycolatopsis sp. lyj-346 TaxID=2789289 RepID=UPI00397E6D1C